MTLRVVLLPLELLLVVNASISEAHNFVDRHLSLQSVEDVLPPPVLHEVDALRTFSDQRSPPGKRDESTNSPDEICSWAGASAGQRDRAGLCCEVAGPHPQDQGPVAARVHRLGMPHRAAYRLADGVPPTDLTTLIVF